MTTAVPTIWQRLRYTRMRDLVRGRLDASFDWRLVVMGAELPREISETISQVVGRTRLWRREKVDVAAELVAHFQDGLEAGCSPEELTKSFGDTQQAAQLIRRAKKRSRSVLWHLWRYGCWACGIAVVAYVAAGLYMLMGRPTITTDYLAIVNERAASTPENKRAWPIYRDALLAMDAKPSDIDPTKPFWAAAESAPGDANWTEAEKFLTDHADDMAKLREATARRELGFVTATSHAAFTEKDRELFGVTVAPEDIEALKHQTIEDRWIASTLLPYLNVLRQAAPLLANDARRAAMKGDGNTALADVVALFGMSHHCQESPFLVNLLVASAVQKQAIAAIHDVMRDQPGLWTNDQVRDLAHRIAAAQIDWRHGIESERLSFYDSMQRIYTDNGNGDGRLALQVTPDKNLFELVESVAPSDNRSSTFSNDGLAALALPAANMVVASRKEMTEMFERFMGRALQKIETPLWEDPKSPTLDEEIQALEVEPLGKYRYLFVRLMVPAFDSLRSAIAYSNGERDGVLLGLALELYHREHQKWPESLNELAPRWLPEMPLDRITGKPLQYKIVDDRPVVYSVGADLDDDGGQIPLEDGEPSESGAWPSSMNSNPTPDGDWVIWSTVARSNNANASADE